VMGSVSFGRSNLVAEADFGLSLSLQKRMKYSAIRLAFASVCPYQITQILLCSLLLLLLLLFVVSVDGDVAVVCLFCACFYFI